VVLPFDDMSPNKDNEYFSDGLTEEIITDLSQIKDLCVISRNSAMALKGTKKNTKTIGKELNVQYVLEGSVRKDGNNIRITAQLIDARTDIHLWAKKYNGTLDDVFEIQEKVSRSIVDSLKLSLTPEEIKKIAEHPIENIQAHECHLKARREMLRTTEDGLKRALQDIQSGLDIVGENALLYADMAMVYIWYVETGIKADEESLLKAEEFAQKVAQLSPESWFSHHLQGMITRFRGSVLQALKHFKKALSINPNIPDSLFALSGGYALQAGKLDAAKPLVKRLLEIDPLTPLNYLLEGIFYLIDLQFDRALSSFEKMIQMEPDSPYPHVWIYYVFIYKKQYDKVLELIDQFLQRQNIGPSSSVWIEWSLFLKSALQGDNKKAYDSLSKETLDWAWNDPEIPCFWAGHYALLDDREKALDWLERGVDRGCINYPMIAEKYPLLDNIRGEERFKKLMERVKYEWENFEV
jgi:TolB-like protein/lipoprotein NlpI